MVHADTASEETPPSAATPDEPLPASPPPRLPASLPSGPAAWPRLPTLAIIRFYQRFVSPMLPPACRFSPTCSEYGYEAIAKYGIIKGGRLAVWRVLRCNPFGRGGYDPVR